MWMVVLGRESDRRGDVIGEVMNHVSLYIMKSISGTSHILHSYAHRTRIPCWPPEIVLTPFLLLIDWSYREPKHLQLMDRNNALFV